MKSEIVKIQQAITPLRKEIINHKVYSVINDIEDLRVFMEYHVYAVWDFMSLLKSLQIGLTCTRVPWFPVGSANTRSLINEIVAGEESDIDANGDKKSHFELYLEAMVQCGADVTEFDRFANTLKGGLSMSDAYIVAETPEAARHFVDYTFSVIEGNKAHEQSSAFTFGREDLIPNMFFSIINDLNKKFPEQISIFKYYLERHIEVDGDHHSHLALEMTAELCGNDQVRWLEAEKAALESLKRRVELWDGAYEQIVKNKTMTLVSGN
ncbi:DUF3050 domain-containing protein [Pedobacter nutrimenti]|uniref:DUF3050 domain-containing protein n=1 Tax=Pedobacter nutrimenti TaxID=1241337 RepID=UPI00292F7731|nr:DUF3050 domain-containing protein [Pedobacter nutrimenti]